MKIATKLHITTVISVTLILVMIAVLFSATRQVKEYLGKNEGETKGGFQDEA